MTSDLNMFHGKMSNFCFVSVIWVHFSHKTNKFWFWKSLKYLYFLIKEIMSDFKHIQIWHHPVNQCLIWFKLCCLNLILAISWEIRILNFIGIVYYFSDLAVWDMYYCIVTSTELVQNLRGYMDGTIKSQCNCKQWWWILSQWYSLIRETTDGNITLYQLMKAFPSRNFESRSKCSWGKLIWSRVNEISVQIEKNQQSARLCRGVVVIITA